LVLSDVQIIDDKSQSVIIGIKTAGAGDKADKLRKSINNGNAGNVVGAGVSDHNLKIDGLRQRKFRVIDRKVVNEIPPGKAGNLDKFLQGEAVRRASLSAAI